MYQAGTLSGTRWPPRRDSPCSTTWGRRTTRPSALALASSPRRRFEAAVAAGGLAVTVPSVGPRSGSSWLTPPRSPTAPSDYEGAGAGRRPHVRTLLPRQLRRGVALAPGAYEVMFPGLAQGDEGGARPRRRAAGESAAESPEGAGVWAASEPTDVAAGRLKTMSENGWSPDFLALRREGCPMCGPGVDETPHGRGSTRAARPTAISAVTRCGRLCLCHWKGRHVAEPTERPLRKRRDRSDVAVVAGAIDEEYRPMKMNWLSLGNGVPHLHVHLVPRPRDERGREARSKRRHSRSPPGHRGDEMAAAAAALRARLQG